MATEKEGVLSIVLVDDEESILFSSATLLEMAGITPVATLQDGRQLLPYLADHGAAVVVLDLVMPHISGVVLLKEMAARFPAMPVVVMTAVHEADTAVACMKEGAFDYLIKPVEKSRFVSCVQRAVELGTLRASLGDLKERLLSGSLGHPEAFAAMVTRSRKMHAIFQYVESIATSREPVLIEGETGVGKELLVAAIHRLSGRKGKLVALNVAGLDETTFSDTLFGHRRGAFTGADRERSGLVATAAAGHMFLDEIGDLGAAQQVKLLRLLQDRRYFPLGSDLAMTTDARFVFATHRNLQEMTAQGEFRQDLFYRLAGHRIRVPPLRERKEDMPLLVHHFVEEAATAMGKKMAAMDPELPALLARWPFPGNVRELRAMIHDAVARNNTPRLSLELFREMAPWREESATFPPLSPEENPFRLFPDPLPTCAEAEAWLMAEALRRSGDNKSLAADLLGITRQTINRRLRERDSG